MAGQILFVGRLSGDVNVLLGHHVRVVSFLLVQDAEAAVAKASRSSRECGWCWKSGRRGSCAEGGKEG